MYFQFTLFNSITLFVMVLTGWMAYARFNFRLESNWFLLYYAVIVAYSQVFEGALGVPWVLGGLVCGLLLRFEFLGGIPLKVLRGAELVFFGYVLWRGLALLMMW